jgi:hypothetical protein
MNSQPVPHQASPEHLASLSTPELVAERIRLHEVQPQVVEETSEAQARFNLSTLNENPTREAAADRLSNAHTTYNLLLQDILVTDEVLRHRNDDATWLRDEMYRVLRRSDRNKYYDEYEYAGYEYDDGPTYQEWKDSHPPTYQEEVSKLKATVNFLINGDNQNAA